MGSIPEVLAWFPVTFAQGDMSVKRDELLKREKKTYVGNISRK